MKSKFEDFAAAIGPYQKFWTSSQISGIAFRHDDKWILAGLRIVLSTAAPELRVAEEILDCYLIDVVVPYPEFSQIAYSTIVHGHIPPQLVGGTLTPPMFLSKHHAGLAQEEFRLDWSFTRLLREGAKAQYLIDCETIAISAPLGPLNGILPPESRSQYEAALRRADVAFDGLEGAGRVLLPGQKCEAHHGGEVRILAPLNVSLNYGDVLTVNAPAGSALDLRLFFNNGMTSSLIPVRLTDEGGGIGIFTVPVDWPNGSSEATVAVLTSSQHIMSSRFPRWPQAPTLRLAMNSYFDPLHEKLRSMLISRESLEFEKGVVRLLNLLGVPAVWYPSAKGGRRPDAAALCESEKGSMVFLVECTTEKPIEKFSPLRTRAQELSAHLQGQCRVLPIVFASCPIYPDEAAAAEEHSVSLVGQQDIAYITGLLNANLTPEQIYGVFSKLCQAMPFREWFRI